MLSSTFGAVTISNVGRKVPFAMYTSLNHQSAFWLRWVYHASKRGLCDLTERPINSLGCRTRTVTVGSDLIIVYLSVLMKSGRESFPLGNISRGLSAVAGNGEPPERLARRAAGHVGEVGQRRSDGRRRGGVAALRAARPAVRFGALGRSDGRPAWARIRPAAARPPAEAPLNAS